MTYGVLTYGSGNEMTLPAVESAEFNQGAVVITYTKNGERRALTVAPGKWIDFEMVEEGSDNAQA